MSKKSNQNQYGSIAVSIHWLSALLILFLIGSGLTANGIEDNSVKSLILRVHVPIGILVLLLTITRIIWWIFVDKKPQPISMPSWQKRVSQAVHILLYVVILGMTASGIGMMILSGAGPIIFGGNSAELPNFWEYAPRTPHGIGARVILALLILHAGAAIHHHFVKKDGLLRRMWYSKDSFH